MKKWIEMTIVCRKDFLPNLTGLLMSNKIKIWAEEENEDNVRLFVYLPYFEELQNNIESLSRLLEVEQVRVISREIDDENWAISWQKYFNVEQIGKRIVIKPPWENYKAGKDKIVLEIEPRMAFGSGFHPTTKLTVLLSEKYIRPGMKVMDMGCGSGILSILAGYLGATEIIAIDNDPIAIRETRENFEMARSKIPHEKIKLLILDAEGFVGIRENLDTYQIDIMMVNISTNFLLENIASAANHLKPGGILLTGSIEMGSMNKFLEMSSAQGFEELEHIEMDGWSGVALRRI